MSDLIYIDKIMHNGSGVTKLFHNESIVKKLYHGDDLLFRALGGKPYLILSETQLSLNFTGETKTVTVVSSNPYTATTTSDWITLEQNGQTLSITASSAQSDRNGIITVSTNNGYFSINDTISVSQKSVNYVSWISMATNSWGIQNNINTGVAHTASTISIRCKFKRVNTYSDRDFGYHYGDAGCIGDSNDLRTFCYGSGCFDYKTNRSRNLGIVSTNVDYDLTIGDNYLYDNLNHAYIYQGTSFGTVPSLNCNIVVDVSTLQIKELIIQDGDIILFNGKAAIDPIGNIGLYDTVSETYKYNPNLEMTYGE